MSFVALVLAKLFSCENFILLRGVRECLVLIFNYWISLINHSGQGYALCRHNQKNNVRPQKHSRDGGVPGRTVGPTEKLEDKKEKITAKQCAVKVHPTPDAYKVCPTPSRKPTLATRSGARYTGRF